MVALRKLVVMAFIPLMVCVLLYFEEKKEKYNKYSKLHKQLFFGLIFGFLAALSTQYGR